MAGPGEPWAPKRLLCATDFSANAAAALEAAVALARLATAKVMVVHVMPRPRPATGAGTCWPAPPGVSDPTRADVVENLERFARPAIAAGVEIERVVRQGEPAQEILREAQRAGADLIVMGRHSRSPDHWFLGSVAEHVVGGAPCPVLAVKPLPHRRGRPRHVVCALDLGETAPATLAHAAALTRALDAELLVLHVVAGGAQDTIQDARAGLAAVAAGVSVPAARVQQRVVEGTPREEILGAAAGEGETDRVVVVGSHGGGIRNRPFVGSTTLHLLRNSECDVLVVPAPTAPAAERSNTLSPPVSAAPPPRSLGRAQ